MDESSQTAAHIQTDIASLDHRYAIVEPGERCYICQYPLLSRQFFVFPCQHAFHGDCLSKVVIEHAGVGKGRRIKELQMEVSRGMRTGSQRERAIKELDSLVAASWQVPIFDAHGRSHPQCFSLSFVFFFKRCRLIFFSVLCSEFAVKQIDEPFVQPTDNQDEWAL